MRLRPSLPMAALFALCASLAAPPAQAWGGPAHRVVAELAEAQLRPAARDEVRRLLAAEAEPRLAAVSDWADEHRDAVHRSSRWHYVDFHAGGGCEYLPARDCPDGDCVIAAIEREYLRLADRSRGDGERAEALKYLVHLVADVHQPLHAAPGNDHGGLDFQVGWHGKGRNLHGVWDALIIDRALDAQHHDEGAYLRLLQARAPLPPDPTRASPHPVVDWALESCHLASEAGFYPPSHKLGDDYLDAHREEMELRLRLAGARLAAMLNAALDPPPPGAQP